LQKWRCLSLESVLKIHVSPVQFRLCPFFVVVHRGWVQRVGSGEACSKRIFGPLLHPAGLPTRYG
jgi:hypothetical protein